MSATPILANSPDAFPNFNIRIQIATIFLEYDKHLLLLKRCHKEDQPDKWGIPGGKAKLGESHLQTILRELTEETRIELDSGEIDYLGHRYARIPNWDYVVHIYRAQLKEKPEIQINPKEHQAFLWQPIDKFSDLPLDKFSDLPLIEGQFDAFHFIYG